MVLKVAVPGGGQTKLIVPVIEHPFLPNHFFPPATRRACGESVMPQSGKEPVSCTTAQKQTFAMDRGKKILLPIYALKSRGLGEERGSTAAGSAYPLGYEFPPRAWSAAAERGSQRL